MGRDLSRHASNALGDAGQFVEIETRVLDDTHAVPGFNRGAHFVNKLQQELGLSIAGKNIADLGAGYGSNALACAAAGASHVVALDASADRVKEIALRAKQQGLSVEAIHANLLLPFAERLQEPVDVALLIGVVEYAGLWQLDQSVDELQGKVLRHAFESLKPGGILIMATKNRLWPSFMWRDIHTGQPLVNILPRSLADRLSLRLDGKPYREHVRSPQGWSKIVQNAGFRNVTTYVPIFSYQYPLMITKRLTVAQLRSAGHRSLVEGEYQLPDVAYGRLSMAKALLIGLSSMLHLPISHSLIVVAER